MKTITLPFEDYHFLKELQQELNTQDNCGEPRIYFGEGITITLEDAVDLIGEYIDENNTVEWNGIDKSDMEAVVEFCKDILGWKDTRIVYMDTHSELSQTTGAFLTKRACQEYVENFGYNHQHPKPYAMTAFRNFELERLLNILKSLNFEEE